MCLCVPAELDEGSWLVEGRLDSSDVWAGSSTSVCDTASSEASVLYKHYSDTIMESMISQTPYGTRMNVFARVDLRAHTHLSPASMNMSSLSSIPLVPAGALRPGVEVLTVGTD